MRALFRSCSFLVLGTILLSAFCLWPWHACAEDLEMINRPINVDGLTGLLVTTIPYTMPRRTIEVGAASIAESSHLPDYTIDTYPLLLNYGLTDNMEIAARTSYIVLQHGNEARLRGSGDSLLSWKWNFRPQQEDSIKPALSLFLTGILPTGNAEKGTNTVDHWGARLGLSIGSEIPVVDYILGVYADAQVAIQDLSDGRSRDRYQLLNAGVLLPISKYRNLQMMIEYNARNGADVFHMNLPNYSAVTYGIRLVSQRFNLTFGAQFIHKTAAGFEDANRVTAIASMKM